MPCPMTKHLLPAKNLQSTRVLLSLDMLNIACRDVNSYMHKLVFTVSPFKLLPKRGKCKYMTGSALVWNYLYWWVCIGTLQCVACVEGLVLYVCASGSMCCACLLSGQYTSRNVQRRLAARAHDLWGRGMTENLSGNLQLQLETLEL